MKITISFVKLNSCYNFITIGNHICQFPKLSLPTRSYKNILSKDEHYFRMSSQARISLIITFLVTWRDDSIDRGIHRKLGFHFRF